MKLLTIVGARPQFVKAAVVSQAIHAWNADPNCSLQINEELIHTGQHFDENMSDVFFSEMKIPRPSSMLHFGGLKHGEMTGRMLEAIEREIEDRSPDCVLVYGDTNSTLAGALAAAKLQTPVAHVEAGLRSFNRGMPEEINRVLTDHVSSLLFCPTTVAVRQLESESITTGVHHVGDVMYDAAIAFAKISETRSQILRELSLEPNGYVLSTIHRPINTDDPENLRTIFEAFLEIAATYKPVVLPIHPRTVARLKQFGLDYHNMEERGLRLVDPVGFIDMVQLEKHASLIATDSGGVQKEAYFHGVPCLTLREETEWVETIEYGWNQLVGASKAKIIAGAKTATTGRPILEYGDGNCGESIVKVLASSVA